MALHYRILGWIVSRDWRGLLGRVWWLAWRLGGVAGRIAAAVAWALVRHALTLADWALRWPRLALGTGLALVLTLGTLALLWPAASSLSDLSRGAG